MFEKVVVLCGMPRSGTSWLGQIFDSVPSVAFRMEPLFAYRFKNCIDTHSSKEAIEQFLCNVYQTDDDFILQKENRAKGYYPVFAKDAQSKVLVVKTTRHHHLLSTYLAAIDNLSVVSIIRHPCAVINSWIKSDREFNKKGCSVDTDWRSGACRKTADEEYWGFDDWLAITKQHVELSHRCDRMHLIRYSDLMNDAMKEVRLLFDRLGVDFAQQTQEFLQHCHERHIDDPYAVFKSRAVEHSWKQELRSDIADEIVCDVRANGLDLFLA